MTTATLDPAAVIAGTVRELVDSVRKLVEPDTDDPAVLDELSRLVGLARRRINRATKRAEPEAPAPAQPVAAPTPTQSTTSAPVRPVAQPAAIPSPVKQSVTLPIPEATSPRHRATTQESVVSQTPQQPQPQHWQQQPPPYQPPRRRRRIWPWVLLGIVILFAGGCIAVLANVGKEIQEQSRPVLVTYEITGEGAASSITYTKDVNLGQEQLTAATPLPWRHEVQFGEGFFKPLSIVAQAGETAGPITCRILVDGTEVAKSTSQGQFAVVTCSGDVPKR